MYLLIIYNIQQQMSPLQLLLVKQLTDNYTIFNMGKVKTDCL